MSNSLASEIPPSPSPMGNGLMSPPQSPGPQAPGPTTPAAPVQPAPPTHAQTIAALRHFDAIRRELEAVAADPALGKSNVKSKIIDGFLRLVAAGYVKTVDAVDQLSKVPAEPLLQMKWVKGMYAQAQTAENGILDHYGMSQPHFGTVDEHYVGTKGMESHGDHGDHMSALGANYGAKKA